VWLEIKTTNLLDWDIFARGGVRDKLDIFYKKLNKNLLSIVGKENIPNKYL